MSTSPAIPPAHALHRPRDRRRGRARARSTSTARPASRSRSWASCCRSPPLALRRSRGRWRTCASATGATSSPRRTSTTAPPAAAGWTHWAPSRPVEPVPRRSCSCRPWRSASEPAARACRTRATRRRSPSSSRPRARAGSRPPRRRSPAARRCLPTGSWTINPGGISGTGTNTTISGLATGTHNYTVTDGSGCTSSASGNVVIDAQPATPTAPTVGTITQPTCSEATGSVVLGGLPTGSWTINPGGISGGTGTSTTISGLATGTHNYTVTDGSGCTSSASGNVVIDAQPATPTAPTVGTITQPTCSEATGSVVLGGLPTGSWTINPGGISGTGTSTTISGLATGTHNYTVTDGSGCTSSASGNVVIDAQPATPTAPTVGTITQPTCSEATGSVVLGGLPTGSWTINPGGISGTGTSTTISGLATGTHNYTVTDGSGCDCSIRKCCHRCKTSDPHSTDSRHDHAAHLFRSNRKQVVGLQDRQPDDHPQQSHHRHTDSTISGLATGTHNYTVTDGQDVLPQHQEMLS